MFSLTHALAVLIEAVGSLLLGGFVLAAGMAALRGRAPEHVRLLLADGAILVLSFKAGAALLKTMDLPDWNRIAGLAAILALRTVLKRVLVAERAALARDDKISRPEVLSATIPGTSPGVTWKAPPTRSLR